MSGTVARREALGALGRGDRALADDRATCAGSRPSAGVELRRLRRALAAGRSTTSRTSGPRSGTSSTSQADGELRPASSAAREMPGAEWFPGTELNYAEHVFRGKDDDEVAILHASELRELERADAGASCARRSPPSPPACARSASSAATASSPTCRTSPRRSSPSSPPPPRRGLVELLARLRPGQRRRPLRPDRAQGPVRGRRLPLRRQGLRPPRRRRRARRRQMPTLERTVVLPYLEPDPDLAAAARRDPPGTSCSPPARAPSSRFERVPFDHPLWVLYSSGTTGLPKAIVQGQGGILLEHLKKLHLHVDAQPGDRVFWFTTTGWMMWNFLVSGLLTRAAIVLYDGSPGHPDMGVLWDLAERAGVTCFGTSASYIAACMKAGRRARRRAATSAALRAVGSTGSPLSPEGFDWVYEHVGADTWLFSTSGGTDVCTAFVGGVPTPARLPRRAPGAGARRRGRGLGRGRQLGDRRGRRAGRHRADALDAGLLLGRRGRQPLPRQLLRACTRASGATATGSRSPRAARRSSTAAPTRRSTARASAWGRARSTAPCSASPRSLDALVVDVPRPGTEGWMPLFVVLREGAELDDELRARDRPADPRALLAAPRPRRGLRRSPRSRARSPARCSRCRSSGS